MGRSRFTFLALKFSSVIALSACATTVRSADTAPSDTKTAAVAEKNKDALEDLSQDKAPSTEKASRKTAAAESAQTQASDEKSEAAPGAGRAHPSIMQAPVEADGFWLNAVYFPRAINENWQTISQKLYGRPDRAGLLKKWNHDAHIVRIGEPVYYNSPSRPDDNQNIKVFAEDFGYKLETVTIAKGDTLSKLGEAKLGDLRTWKELSAMNPEITNPDLIEVGQVIRMQPRDVDTSPVLQNIIKEVTKTEETKQNQAGQVAQTNQVEQLPEAQQAAPAPKAPAAPTAAVAQVGQKAQTEVSKTMPAAAQPATTSKVTSESKASNMLGMTGALLLLTAAGMVIYRRIVKFRATKTHIQS